LSQNGQPRAGRIVFAVSHLNFWVQMETVGRLLAQRGHEVSVLFDARKNWKFNDRIDWLKDEPPYRMGDMVVREDAAGIRAEERREALNYLSYYLPQRGPFNRRLAERWSEFLAPQYHYLRGRPGLCRTLAFPPVFRALKTLSSAGPLHQPIVDDLRSQKCDLLVAVPTLLPQPLEYEYLRTAKRLGIPTAIVVPSWDNLTSKGVFHTIPDRMFVWNEPQIREAEEMLSVPRERLAATGAPRYDRWFSMQPTRTREEFCREAGLDPAKPFIVWLCSSTFIAKDEAVAIRDVARALAADPRWKESGAQFLVRPHFQNLPAWAQESQADGQNLLLWPRPSDLERFKLADLHQDFFDTLTHASGVIGINTSAFLEAAIVDRPCMTLLDQRFQSTQADIPHFQHLVRAGFLETARTLPELCDIALAITRGGDRLAEPRRRFVREFLRPRGLETPACTVLANEIDSLLQKSHTQQPQRSIP